MEPDLAVRQVVRALRVLGAPGRAVRLADSCWALIGVGFLLGVAEEGPPTELVGAVHEHHYHETVGPCLRGIFAFRPKGELMVDIPFVFQAHAVPAWILFAIWPFTRLVHAWNIPIAYFRRPPIVYRPPRATAAGRARAPSVANLAASASSEVRVA